jgi:hypothetical protein
MNVHDEVLSVTHPDYVDAVTAAVVECVESFRDRVPLIGMSWVKSMENWAGKKGGGENLEVNITPGGVEGFDEEDLQRAVESLRDECYVEPTDGSELEDLEEAVDPCPEMSSLEDLI